MKTFQLQDHNIDKSLPWLLDYINIHLHSNLIILNIFLNKSKLLFRMQIRIDLHGLESQGSKDISLKKIHTFNVSDKFSSQTYHRTPV